MSTTDTPNNQPEFLTTGQATPTAALNCSNGQDSFNHTEHLNTYDHHHPIPLGQAVHTAALTYNHHHHPTTIGLAVPSAALYHHTYPTTNGQAVPSAALHHHTHPTTNGQAAPTAAQNHHTYPISQNHTCSITQKFNNVTTKYTIKYRNKNTRKTAFKHAKKETQRLINRQRYITNLSSKTLNPPQLDVLALGLTFIPSWTPPKINLPDSLNNFDRSNRLKYFFRNQPSVEPHPFKKKSTWQPPTAS